MLLLTLHLILTFLDYTKAYLLFTLDGHWTLVCSFLFDHFYIALTRELLLLVSLFYFTVLLETTDYHI